MSYMFEGFIAPPLLHSFHWSTSRRRAHFDDCKKGSLRNMAEKFWLAWEILEVTPNLRHGTFVIEVIFIEKHWHALLLSYMQVWNCEGHTTVLINNKNDIKCSVCVVWHCHYWFQTLSLTPVSEFDGAIICNVYWSEASAITLGTEAHMKAGTV